jgi:hypothetical protein
MYDTDQTQDVRQVAPLNLLTTMIKKQLQSHQVVIATIVFDVQLNG